MSQEPIPDLPAAVLTDHCHLRIPSQPDWIGSTVDYLVQRAVRSGAIESSARHASLNLLSGRLGLYYRSMFRTKDRWRSVLSHFCLKLSESTF